MYYKASICLSTKALWLNPETNTYEGCDPETYQNHGQIREIAAPTLNELRTKIEREYFKLSKPIGADVQIFDNIIEIQYEGEHDYRTPKKDRIPFIETTSIYITRVIETEVDLGKESVFADLDQY